MDRFASVIVRTTRSGKFHRHPMIALNIHFLKKEEKTKTELSVILSERIHGFWNEMITYAHTRWKTSSAHS